MKQAGIRSWHLNLVAAVTLLVGWGGVWAQAAIYTCTDAQGRVITSDRPIPACIDRPQRELGHSGITRRVIPPTPTAVELQQQALRERQAAELRQRALDAIRRDQVLVTRYPDQAAHDAEREHQLAELDRVVHTAELHIAELQAERRKLDNEMEFYRVDPARAPAMLRLSIQNSDEAMHKQRQLIASQQAERDRINARFDEEAMHLRTLWRAQSSSDTLADDS